MLWPYDIRHILEGMEGGQPHDLRFTPSSHGAEQSRLSLRKSGIHRPPHLPGGLIPRVFACPAAKLHGPAESLNHWCQCRFVEVATFRKGFRTLHAQPQEAITESVAGFRRFDEPAQFIT